MQNDGKTPHVKQSVQTAVLIKDEVRLFCPMHVRQMIDNATLTPSVQLRHKADCNGVLSIYIYCTLSLSLSLYIYILL